MQDELFEVTCTASGQMWMHQVTTYDAPPVRYESDSTRLLGVATAARANDAEPVVKFDRSKLRHADILPPLEVMHGLIDRTPKKIPPYLRLKKIK